MEDDEEEPTGPQNSEPLGPQSELSGDQVVDGTPLKAGSVEETGSAQGPDDEEPDEAEGDEPLEGGEVAPAVPERKLDSLRVMEAALFLGNKTLAFPEIALVAKTSVRKARELAEKLRKEYEARDGSLEVAISADGVSLQVKPDYLSPVSHMSKEVDLSRKGTKMLSLIAKKGKMLQSELKRYFRGEIYAYVSELKERGYITSEKAGATRLLRTTEKFKESFQMGSTG